VWCHAHGRALRRGLLPVRVPDQFAGSSSVSLLLLDRSNKSHARNLQEAITLFLEAVSAEEIEKRWRSEVYVTQVEVAVG